jgi:hypothetical protein
VNQEEYWEELEEPVFEGDEFELEEPVFERAEFNGEALLFDTKGDLTNERMKRLLIFSDGFAERADEDWSFGEFLYKKVATTLSTAYAMALLGMGSETLETLPAVSLHEEARRALKLKLTPDLKEIHFASFTIDRKHRIVLFDEKGEARLIFSLTQ